MLRRDGGRCQGKSYCLSLPSLIVPQGHGSIQERTRTLKHKPFFILLILVIALAACGSWPEPTKKGAETESTQEDAHEADPTPNLLTQTGGEAIEATGPGGVEVALTLVTIPDQGTIVVVNGTEISTAAYEEELTRALYSVTAQYGVDWNDPANGAFLPSFQEQVLNELIDRSLLQQLADEAGITADPEAVDERIAEIETQVLQDPTFVDWESFLTANNLTDEVLRDMIAHEIRIQELVALHGGAQAVEQVHASHILVETEETGQEVLDKLEAGEDFGELAAVYSTDPGSKDQDGDLGWFARGMMVPEFEEAAFSLEPGETSGLVQSDFGYHIILVHDRGERDMDPAFLGQQQQLQFQAWLDARKAEADIERLFTFEELE